MGPLPPDEAEENIPRALVGWLAGCTMIWSALFATGNFLYGRTGYAVALTALFAITAAVLVAIVRPLWRAGGA